MKRTINVQSLNPFLRKASSLKLEAKGLKLEAKKLKLWII